MSDAQDNLDTDTIPPISDTAFYCCGIRAHDARTRFPICNDIYAQDFMTTQGRAVFEKYKPGFFATKVNSARPRIIDNLVTTHLRANPDLRIVLVGAGFDSRAFRLAGGDWLEIDEAAIINHKQNCLPVENCPNPLRRVSIDYAKDSLAEILKAHTTPKEHLFIVEGVFMYLEVAEIESTLQALSETSPSHTLICDLMTRHFINTYAKGAKKKFDAMGAVIKCQTNRPESVLVDHGYSLIDEISIPDGAIQYSAARIPKLLVPKKARGGFRVMRFEM